MQRVSFKNLLFFSALFTCTSVHGQSIQLQEPVGWPYGLRNFFEDELPNQGQNWSIVQDKRGITFVANHAGVLEYDGNEWRLITIADYSTAFSVNINQAGIIFVGARDDFGYLAPDSSGSLVYVSLADHVREEDAEFGVIWATSATSDGVYFQANSHLFRWDGEALHSWRSAQRMHTSFAVNDRFYLKRDGIGLMVMGQDSLMLIPGGERFADRRVFFMTSIAEDVLIGAQKDMDGPLELYKFDGMELHTIPVDAHLLNEHYAYTFYHGAELPNGYFALASLYNGVFVIDQDGKLVETLDAERGVNEDVNFAYSDYQGGLWLAHNVSGVSYIAAPMGLSEFGDGEGLRSGVNAILRHKGRLYAAADNGLFRLSDRYQQEEGSENTQFERMSTTDNSEGIHWSLLSYGDELLVAAEHGIIGLKNGVSRFIAFEPPDIPDILYESLFFDGRVYAGLQTGLGVLTQSGSEWIAEKIGVVSRKINSIAEEADGSLWVSTVSPSDVWKIRFDSAGNLLDETQVTSSKELGVASVQVVKIAGDIVIKAVPKGIYRATYQENGSGFELSLDERFPHASESATGAANQLIDIYAISATSYWTLYGDRIETTTIVDEKHVHGRLADEFTLPAWGKFRDVYVDEDDVLWISNENFRPLLKYDPSKRENTQITATRQPLVRRFIVLWADSVLYGGAFSSESAKAKFKKGKVLSIDLPHEDNDLRFDFSLPNYNKQNRIEYQYILEGHDENWSKWTTDAFVVYRNIESGDHNFQVKARIGGVPIEGTASVSLTIRAPWFWSWWSKSFYVIFLGYSIFQFFSYERAKKQLVLLNIERELNARLQLANAQLRSANESLEQANRMKDEFLANASHELRTPLTAILGFTSVLKEEVPEENLEFLGLIDENGKRLLQTINSLLDLAKLRAGMLELNFQYIDIGEKSEEVVDLLGQLAKNQNLTLEIERPEERINVRLDPHCYERILYNLIGNAIKFTHEGGVKVRIERQREEVQVHVIDTGIGINQSFIPVLFDEFKQEPNNEMRTEGSGLGLTITAKLVELLNGKISVKSKKGKGSTFTVSFQIDKIEWATNGAKDESQPEKQTYSTLH